MNLELTTKIGLLVLKHESGPILTKVGDHIFTKHQMAVLVALACGLMEKQVATLLCRHRRTIQFHSHNIKTKLRVNSNMGLTHFAIKHNLIEAGDYIG